MANGITIYPNGQTLVVTALASNVFYTDTGLSSAVTLPAVVGTTTIWYCSPANAGANTFTITQLDGTVLWDEQPVFVGTPADTQLRPRPSLAQLAADTGTISFFRGQSPSSYVESFPRQLAATQIGLASQAFRWSSFLADRTMKVQNVSVCTGNTAAAATPTLVRFGIYTVASDGAMTLVASTTNDTTLLANTYTLNTKALTTPYTITGGSRYAVGGLVVTGATAPTVLALTAYASPVTNLSPATCGQVNSSSDLPATVAAASLNPAGSSTTVWFGLS